MPCKAIAKSYIRSWKWNQTRNRKKTQTEICLISQSNQIKGGARQLFASRQRSVAIPPGCRNNSRENSIRNLQIPQNRHTFAMSKGNK